MTRKEANDICRRHNLNLGDDTTLTHEVAAVIVKLEGDMQEALEQLFKRQTMMTELMEENDALRATCDDCAGTLQTERAWMLRAYRAMMTYPAPPMLAIVDDAPASIRGDFQC